MVSEGEKSSAEEGSGGGEGKNGAGDGWLNNWRSSNGPGGGGGGSCGDMAGRDGRRERACPGPGARRTAPAGAGGGERGLAGMGRPGPAGGRRGVINGGTAAWGAVGERGSEAPPISSMSALSEASTPAQDAVPPSLDAHQLQHAHLAGDLQAQGVLHSQPPPPSAPDSGRKRERPASICVRPATERTFRS